MYFLNFLIFQQCWGFVLACVTDKNGVVILWGTTFYSAQWSFKCFIVFWHILYSCILNCRKTLCKKNRRTDIVIHKDKLFSFWWPPSLKFLQPGTSLTVMTSEGLGAAVIQWPSSTQAAAQQTSEKYIKETKASLLTLSSSSIVPYYSSYAVHLSLSVSAFSPSLLSWCFDPLSRSRPSSGKFIVGGAYSWSSTTPTYRAKGEHLRYTTGTLISENSSALLCVSLEAREEKSTRELCKFKLANFLMEIAVTSEWSCLELKHCCNQYRLSWGWRARTFRSPFVEIMEKTVCYFSQTCRKLADMAGALQVMMLAQRNKYKEERFIKKQTAELCLKLVGARGSQRYWGCIWPTHLETGSLFIHTRDREMETQLSTKAHVKSFVQLQIEMS